MPLQLRLIELFDAMSARISWKGFARVSSCADLNGPRLTTAQQSAAGGSQQTSGALQCILSDFNVVDAPGQCEPRPLGGRDLASVDVNDFVEERQTGSDLRGA